jgi:hypothetical protein
LEQGRQARRRHPLAQRCTEFFNRHGRILRRCTGRRRAVDGKPQVTSFRFPIGDCQRRGRAV